MSPTATETSSAVKIKRYVVPQTGELISVNAETNEVIEGPTTSAKRYEGKHFWKLYMNGFLAVLDALEGKQTKVLIHILKHTRQSDNSFSGTYRSISKHCDLSLDTVRRTMQRLQETGFLIKVQNGSYFISPRILVKGNDQKRTMLENQYRAIEQEHETLHRQREMKRQRERHPGEP